MHDAAECRGVAEPFADERTDRLADAGRDTDGLTGRVGDADRVTVDRAAQRTVERRGVGTGGRHTSLPIVRPG